MVDEHRKVIPFATTGKARHSNEAESFFLIAEITGTNGRQPARRRFFEHKNESSVLFVSHFPAVLLLFSPPPMQKGTESLAPAVKIRQIIDYKLCEPEFPSGFQRRFRLILDYFICIYDISTIARVTLPLTFSSYQVIAPASTSLADIPNRQCTKLKDKRWLNVNNETFFENEPR